MFLFHVMRFVRVQGPLSWLRRNYKDSTFAVTTHFPETMGCLHKRHSSTCYEAKLKHRSGRLYIYKHKLDFINPQNHRTQLVQLDENDRTMRPSLPGGASGWIPRLDRLDSRCGMDSSPRHQRAHSWTPGLARQNEPSSVHRAMAAMADSC